MDLRYFLLKKAHHVVPRDTDRENQIEMKRFVYFLCRSLGQEDVERSKLGVTKEQDDRIRIGIIFL